MLVYMPHDVPKRFAPGKPIAVTEWSAYSPSRKGDKDQLYSQPKVGSESLWTVRSHMDPVFSVDGQYVYFNAWPPEILKIT